MFNVVQPPHSVKMTSYWRQSDVTIDVSKPLFWRHVSAGPVETNWLMGSSFLVSSTVNGVQLHTTFHYHLPIALIWLSTVEKDVTTEWKKKQHEEELLINAS